MITHPRHPFLSLITIILVNYDNLLNKNTVMKSSNLRLRFRNKTKTIIHISIFKLRLSVVKNYTELNLSSYASLRS